jgi:hypothetical protein
VAHPNIAQLVNKILSEESNFEFDLIRASNGIVQNAKNIKKEEKIRIFVENYELMSTFEYLNAFDGCYKCKFEKV